MEFACFFCGRVEGRTLAAVAFCDVLQQALDKLGGPAVITQVYGAALSSLNTIPAPRPHFAAAIEQMQESGGNQVYGNAVDEGASFAIVCSPEPKRPPLDWNKPTPFDNFGPGYVVKSRQDVDDLIPAAHARPFADVSLDGCEAFRDPVAVVRG